MPNSFNKPALQPNDLIQKMVARGLYVDDRQQAQDYLTKVGYYRLSGYTLLLETAGSFATNFSGKALYQRTHVFRSGTSFQELIDLYDVDRYLRLYLLDAIERIEVSFRTILSDHMTLKYANPHWYMDVIHFNTTYNHHKLLQKVQQETRQGDPRKRNAFCDYYYQTYTTPNLPPAWMVTEQLSMGTWSLVYQNLRQSRDKKDIARSFNVGPKELTSWIHALSYLRNLCAHHSRLLKINYVVLPQISPILPNSINHTKLIIFIAVIHYLLKSIPSSSEWIRYIKDLLSRFSQQNHDDLIGFHTNWQNDSFWS